MRPSGAILAGGTVLLGAAVFVSLPTWAGWSVALLAVAAYVVGVGVSRRERWSEDYEKRFDHHLTTVHAGLDEAFSLLPKDDCAHTTWRQLCANSEWFLSYDTAVSKDGKQLLELAKRVYPDNPAAELRKASCIHTTRFDAFHDPARRELAQYLAAAGKKMSSRWGWSFRRWLMPRLNEHEHLIHAVVALEVPLRMRTTHGRTNDLHGTGYAFFGRTFGRAPVRVVEGPRHYTLEPHNAVVGTSVESISLQPGGQTESSLEEYGELDIALDVGEWSGHVAGPVGTPTIKIVADRVRVTNRSAQALSIDFTFVVQALGVPDGRRFELGPHQHCEVERLEVIDGRVRTEYERDLVLKERRYLWGIHLRVRDHVGGRLIVLNGRHLLGFDPAESIAVPAGFRLQDYPDLMKWSHYSIRYTKSNTYRHVMGRSEREAMEAAQRIDSGASYDTPRFLRAATGREALEEETSLRAGTAARRHPKWRRAASEILKEIRAGTFAPSKIGTATLHQPR